MEPRLRPKSDYLHTADWQQLHTLSEHWQSELSFFNDEIRFLKDLINKYFVWLVSDEKIDTLRELSNGLIRAEKTHDQLSKRLQKHLVHLADLIENAFSHDEQVFREEHVRLEDHISEFAEDFKILKKDIFTSTSKAIETERLKRLLAT